MTEAIVELRPVLAWRTHDAEGLAHLQATALAVNGRTLCGSHARRGMTQAEYDTARPCARCSSAIPWPVVRIEPSESVFDIDSWAVAADGQLALGRSEGAKGDA